jgi:dihydrofolate reductase
MRPIIAFNRLSADGYFAGADGNLDWTVPDDELDSAAAKSLPGADTILFGRVTYESFESYWPNAVSDAPTSPDPHAKGRMSAAIRELALWINEANKLVFSKRRKQVSWKNSRLLGEFEPRKVEALKEQPGKAIMLFGSGTIASLLTEHGLIDEYHFIVGPVLLGSGQSFLTGVPKRRKVELVESKVYPSGNVLLRYASRS